MILRKLLNNLITFTDDVVVDTTEAEEAFDEFYNDLRFGDGLR